MSFEIGKKFQLKDFTGEVEVIDRGWFIRLKNLFKPQDIVLKFTEKD